MQLGLQIPDFTWPNGPAKLGKELGDVAKAADEAGFEYLAVMDHFFQIGGVGPVENDMLEAYTTLGYLAAHTERVKLLTVITGVIYRQPGVLAKALTTLDVLSGGRAILGIGAGWNEEESRGLGFPFPSTKERFEMLEEALRYVRQMFSDDDGPFEGDYIVAERLMNVPQALTKPHPPIMIGGSGEKKTLRFVAKYGDACNIFNGPELEHKLSVLKQHCETEGRDYGEINKTVYHILDIGKNGEKADELKAELRRLAGLGVDGVIGMLPGIPDLKLIDVFARDIIPEAANY
ncbi:LLM class F420-dependent oxidoreductase [Amycolatopsis acidicola]|uniref:LLM class F420-dependent oxidoreductase n=1 Tax=Amycolatopsis acidicola TaxID=2596893 RepID=A0A5N0VE50_9PSEU|nr:LLM class F420-dependent oxidoreductase [Amycolatopsis acidicola]KAA9162982.1 LLM class F420-dependent oxidoreductase [Amycolatopsis acidicola]